MPDLALAPRDLLAVGLGDVKVASRSGDVLVAYGLGSCVSVCLYDAERRIGGMAHVVLPKSDGKSESEVNPGKFADRAIPMLISLMQQRGASKGRLRAKVAGGAQLIKIQGLEKKFDIGPRNIEAVKETLTIEGLPIEAEDLGGNRGRTVYLKLDTGKLTVRVAGVGEWEL